MYYFRSCTSPEAADVIGFSVLLFYEFWVCGHFNKALNEFSA